MRPSQHVFRDAWNSQGKGALFSARVTLRTINGQSSRQLSIQSNQCKSLILPSSSGPLLTTPRLAKPSSNGILSAHSTAWKPSISALVRARGFSASNYTLQQSLPQKARSEGALSKDEDELDEDKELEFSKSEKADQAAQINLSAKLSKESTEQSKSAGWGEVWRLIKIAKPETRAMSWAVLFLVISSAVSMSIPASIGKILDIAAAKDLAHMPYGLDVTSFYLLLGGFLTVGAAANYGRIIILRIVGERVVSRLRAQLYRNTFIQNAEFFDANRVGDLISRLGSDTIIVGKSVTQNLSDGLRSFISGVAGFSLMGYVSLKLTGVLAIMFPPVAIGAFFYGRAIRNLSRKIQKNLGTLTKIAEERLGNVRTSQAFTGEIQEVSRYNRQVRRIFDLGKREAYLSATFFSASGWAGNMTMVALLYVGGGMVQQGSITIGELTSFLMYTAYAGSSLFGLSAFYSDLMKGVGAASRLFELQDRKPSISPTIGDPVTSLRGSIKFENVSFSYPTRPKVLIFRELNFEIQPGSNVAIVAPSGAGKSTVASMIMRFYVPNSGIISIAGKDIATMNAKQLRRKIGYVGQEPVLFSGTVAENIAYGRPKATRAEIVSAARRANCTFIGDFPEGLETHVGPRGTQLSGGQKQRIAIARALLKQPDILILDEATSALDAESETLVNEALGPLLRGNNTTISIAHRLSTIKRSDVVICFDNEGRVAEIGPYKKLAANPEGAFSKLMEWQMSGGGGSKIAPQSSESTDEPKGPVIEDSEVEGYAEIVQEDAVKKDVPVEKKT